MDYERLINRTKLFEGLRLRAYLCSEGYWTIGFGRNLETTGLSKDEQIHLLGTTMEHGVYVDYLQRHSITSEHAELLFMADLSRCEELCHKHIKMSAHNDARQAVFIDMCFQMGIGGLLGFKNALRYAASGDYESCAAEILDSQYSLQTPARAKANASQMAAGEWL